MVKIVISYRRTDEATATGWISDRLTKHFGDGSVFLDIDSIPIGKDYRKKIHDTLADTNILIAVIGAKWMEQDESGKRRIDDPTDWVRIELATALVRDLPVIPLLVDGASMPSHEQLPPDLQDFVFRNFITFNTREFSSQIQRLILSLENLIESERPKKNFASIDAVMAYLKLLHHVLPVDEIAKLLRQTETIRVQDVKRVMTTASDWMGKAVGFLVAAAAMLFLLSTIFGSR